MRRTPARRVEPGSALWRGFLASGSSGHDFMRSLSSPRRKVQLPYVIQCIKTAGKLATTSEPGRRHKPLTRWAIQAILQTRRWLPHRAIPIVGDSSFASLELIAAVRRHVRLITRLRLDANLFAPAPPRRPSQRGPRACKGQRLPKLTDVLGNPATRWTRVWVTEWYGDEGRVLEIVSGTAIWYHAGLPPAPIRWVLVRDPAGRREPQAFLSTNLDDKPAAILGRFVWRWRIETTFQGGAAKRIHRRHLGVE